ncbi:MAG: YitT family protein [Acholeplasmatales bacterium]|nr:YitT family protein [Acholeplasmatales bacterium]
MNIDNGPLNGAPIKRRLLDDAFRVTIVVFSSAIYALAVLWFLEPANLLSIGLTSVGQVFNRIFRLWDINIPVGVFTLIFNIPLCILGFKYVSPRFIVYTMLSVVVQSVLLLGFIPTPAFVENIKDDRLFLSIIAGLLSGVGIGVALRYGTSTGGVDIVAQAINLKKGVSIGVFSMLINIVLAVIGGIINQDVATSLYTFIFIIITNLVVDKIHTAYNYLRIDVITSKKDEVSTALITEIKRGCTISNVSGAYTHIDKADVFMVISSYELDHAKRVINAVDPNAFIMVLPVKRVIGAFFKHTII